MARAVALQPDGRIVMTGDFYDLGSDGNRGAVVRLNPDGSVDSVVLTDASRKDYTSAIALQPDGNIPVAGYNLDGAQTDVLLARFGGAMNSAGYNKRRIQDEIFA